MGFRASFRGKWRPEKIHQKSLAIFNAKFPGKFEEKIHKSLLESGQSKLGRMGIFWSIRILFCGFCCQIFVLNFLENTQIQRAPNPPEFAQPRLSRVTGRSFPARGYEFWCVFSYMAGVISHLRNDWPYRNKYTQICTLSLDDRPFKKIHPTQTGLCKFGWLWSSLTVDDRRIYSSNLCPPNTFAI